MQIGRRIYYDLKNGSVVCDTGERQWDVLVTTPDQDLTAYPQLAGKTLASLGIINLNYAERAAEFSNIGTYKVDITTKNLIVYPRLTISSDKTQITANGTDTATITATVADATDTTPVNFQANTGTVYSVTPVSGKATFQFSTTIAGDYTIKATSTKYGTNSVLVKAV